MAIHGNKSQGARTKALAEFKTGELCVLVATDIAARGIDIDQLPHVINFELPNVSEDYVHRIGRTGRAGAQGEALSLVCLDEELFLADIEKLIKRSIPRESVAGFEADPGERAEPIQIGRRTLGGAGGGGGGGGGNGRGAGGGGRGGEQRRPATPGGQPRGNAPARPGSAPQRPAQAGPRGGRPQGAGSSTGTGAGPKRPALTSGRRSG
jgi:ATP-dependent RNA helicase RhlE